MTETNPYDRMDDTRAQVRQQRCSHRRSAVRTCWEHQRKTKRAGPWVRPVRIWWCLNCNETLSQEYGQ